MHYKGIVDWFDIEKGYGFIKSDSFKSSIFVHFASIETNGFKYLNEEDVVEFDVVEGNRGWSVKNVRKL